MDNRFLVIVTKTGAFLTGSHVNSLYSVERAVAVVSLEDAVNLAAKCDWGGGEEAHIFNWEDGESSPLSRPQDEYVRELWKARENP